jgi:lipid-A-disaccharide synthase
MAYMGFAEVLRHLPTIAQILNKAREAINRERPDALILIDYPSFNLKLAKYAKTVLGIPVFYYISPKVWAWKEYRVKEMRRYCDKVLSILPFEVDYFRDKQLDVEYVGNPSVAEVERKKANMMSRGEMNMRFGLDGNRPLLALIPGSRKGEIRGNLPFMVETALNFPQLQPVVAAAPSMPISFYRELQIPKLNHIPIIENATFELMAHSEVALVTSGTATLECALLETPQVVCYRSSGKKWFYNLMSHVLKCPHISLPNLIANGLRGERYANEVVPELLMHHCNTAEMTAHLSNLLPGKPGREQMLNGYRRMKSQLTASSAPARAAASILASLRH